MSESSLAKQRRIQAQQVHICREILMAMAKVADYEGDSRLHMRLMMAVASIDDVLEAVGT
jgi:hypothetical protein